MTDRDAIELPSGVDVERLLDNVATAAQERALMRDEDGAETALRDAVCDAIRLAIEHDRARVAADEKRRYEAESAELLLRFAADIVTRINLADHGMDDHAMSAAVDIVRAALRDAREGDTSE